MTILELDYREIKGHYDKIVICGMIEHVGYKNYRRIFKIVEKNLADDGLFLLHTIGSDTSVTKTDSWIDKYIFPNGMLPSIAQIGKAIEKLFVMEDWHNFSAYYDPTLMAWFKNFEKNWDTIKADYDETIPPHVEILSAFVRGLVPRAKKPALADRAFETWRSGWL